MMKPAIVGDCRKMHCFGDLERGEFFCANGEVYMKVSYLSRRNSLQLKADSEPHIAEFCDSQHIQPFDAKLRVDE